ncbi:MAG: aminoglycoside phosphotransferase family protein [Actinobacteria bacterium]|nr:aminoglycoside phosphotransferase family protein [Actinomycetota bacterium]MCA1721127.1 aminoglycoside phosphotransferase family protein [Actinomycetota bacterium]
MTELGPSAALAWAASHGAEPVGEVTTPHVRPWSTALRIPTADGVVWLKACSPGTSHEPALLQALAAYGAPHLLEPLAVDVERGWLLLPEGGRTLRQQLDADPDPSHWERVLPRYAQLQRAVEGMPLPGCDDLRPQRLPLLLDELLDTAGVAPEQLPHLRALQPRYADWCAELEASAVQPTVQHDDLHDSNVFAGRNDDLFFDWGDACLSTPFGSLLVVLRSAARRWELPAEDPVLRRLRDAYLEAWTDVHSREELELLALLATRVTKVCRSLSWQRALGGALEHEDAEAVPAWLEELLEPDVF